MLLELETDEESTTRKDEFRRAGAGSCLAGRCGEGKNDRRVAGATVHQRSAAIGFTSYLRRLGSAQRADSSYSLRKI